MALDITDRDPVTKEEAEVKKKCPPKRNWAELRRMCVDNSFRKMGIAQKLHVVLQTHADTEGFDGIMLTTSTAQPEAHALYRKMGYVETGVDRIPIPLLSQAVGVHTFELELRKT